MLKRLNELPLPSLDFFGIFFSFLNLQDLHSLFACEDFCLAGLSYFQLLSLGISVFSLAFLWVWYGGFIIDVVEI